MPTKYRLKNLFKGKLVQVLANFFIKLNFTPNMISIFGFLSTIVAFLLFIFLPFPINSIIFAILLFWIMLLDGVDGTVARMTNQVTFFGGIFDSILDRYSDVIILIGFLFVYPPNLMILLPLYIWVLIAIVGFIMVSYTRARGEKERLGDLNVGLGGRTERLFIIFIFSILIFPYIGLIIATIISHLTVLWRVIHFYHLSKQEKEK